MNRPPTRVMLLGHPVVSVPAMLTAVGTLVAGIYIGNAFLCLVGMAEIGVVQSASAQAHKYRLWKAEWDAMAENPPPPSLTLGRTVAAVFIAGLLLLGYYHSHTLVYHVAYALGWTAARPWLVAGPIAGIVLLQIIRRRARRAKAPRPVAVVARPLFRTPSLKDAARVLPPYCQSLLGDRQ